MHLVTEKCPSPTLLLPRSLAAVTTTWILIGQGNVATGHVIRSHRLCLTTIYRRPGCDLIPRSGSEDVPHCPWPLM
jgi:hypothetical protein